MNTRINLTEMMSELITGIINLSDIIFSNLELIKSGLHILLNRSIDQDVEKPNKLQTDLILIKNNDLALRSIGDKLEALAIKILSLQAPVSRDLRRVISSFRMIYDLERISRDVYNAYTKILDITAENSRVYTEQLKLILEIISVGEELLKQFKYLFKLSPDEVVDIEQSIKNTVKLDNTIDEIFLNSTDDLMKMANKGIIVPETAFNLISCYRSLERMGDHCCNLIERVIYTQTGDKLIIK